MKTVEYFTINKKTPYKDWYEELGKTEQAIVEGAIDLLSFGNTGKAKSLKGGLWELRLHISSGLRIYFAYEGDKLIVLLCGGDKSTQKKDIERARLYLEIWRTL